MKRRGMKMSHAGFMVFVERLNLNNLVGYTSAPLPRRIVDILRSPSRFARLWVMRLIRRVQCPGQCIGGDSCVSRMGKAGPGVSPSGTTSSLHDSPSGAAGSGECV